MWRMRDVRPNVSPEVRLSDPDRAVGIAGAPQPSIGALLEIAIVVYFHSRSCGGHA